MNRQHLLAVLWLRWRLSRNQFVRAGRLNAAISVVVLALLLAGGAALGVGGFLLGFFALATEQPLVSLAIWDGVMFALLIFWGTGLMVEIQRSESVDIFKLLHLPIHLRQVFFLNYVSSLASPILILFVPLMLGVAAGQTLRSGLRFALLAPLALGFLFMLTSWTYCLRGWLSGLMMNKRRRRTVIFWTTAVFVLAAQAPNLLFNSPLMRQKHHGSPVQSIPLENRAIQAHVLVPPGWVGYGALWLRQGNPWPAVAGTAAGTLLGVLGLLRAYTLTIRFYTGVGKESESASSRKVLKTSGPATPGTARPALLVERKLPFLSEDTAALALATFRSLLRAPELRWALLMPIILGIVMSGARLAQPGKNLPSELILQFAGTGAILLSCFAFGTAMCNSFGLDRDGFRALILLPIRRHFVLLAKNLAFLPFLLISVLVLLVAARLLWRIPWSACFLAPLQLLIVFPLFSLVCNTMSILVPYRIAPGTLNAKKPRPIIFVGIFGAMMVMPLALLPGAIPPVLQVFFSQLKWAPWLPVNFLSALILIPLTAALYWAILPPLGELLQRREIAILSQVTEEVE